MTTAKASIAPGRAGGRPCARVRPGADPRRARRRDTAIAAAAEPAGRPDHHPSRGRPAARGSRVGARHRDPRRPAAPRSPSLQRPQRGPEARRAAHRRAGDRRGRGQNGSGAPDEQAAAADRRGRRRRSKRSGDRGVVQPGMARRSASAGDPAAPLRQARAGPLSGRRARVRRCRVGPPHDRDGPGPPGGRGADAEANPRVGVAGHRSGGRCPRAAAGRASRPPPVARRRPTRSWRPTFPTASPTRNALASGSRSRSCSCTRSRSRRAANDASRAGPGSRSERRPTAVAGWLASLPFELTGGQQDAIGEIDGDLVRALPMQRLLMGEVGSGKTVLALYAMLRAVEAGFQAALMAPTETLAEQHAATLDRLLAAPGRPVHAVDERHAGGAAARRTGPARFRRALDRGRDPRPDRARHRVSPTRRLRGRRAAPVRRRPAGGARRQGAGRSCAPRAPHDRDADPANPLADRLRRSRRERPARAAGGAASRVDTWVVGEEKRSGAYEFIRARLREGRQAYVVCPLVEHRPERAIRGIRGTRGEGRGGGGGALETLRIRPIRGRAPARTAAGRAQAGRDGAIRLGTHAGARRHQRDRGGHRRRERDRDAGRGRGAFRALPAPPAARAGWGAASTPPSASCSETPAPSSRGGASMRSAPSETDSSLPRSTWPCAERVRSSGPASTECRASGWPTCPTTSGLLTEARREVIALRDRYGSLAAPELGPMLEVARRRFGDEGIRA